MVTIRDLIASNPQADDKAIAELCAADPRTARPIQLDELRPLLTVRGIFGRLFQAALVSADAANVYSYVNSGNVTIRSDTPEYAATLEKAMAGLTQLGLTAQDQADIIALGGGYAVRGATLEQITAERAAMTEETAKADVRQKLADAYNAEVARLDAAKELPKGTVTITWG